MLHLSELRVEESKSGRMLLASVADNGNCAVAEPDKERQRRIEKTQLENLCTAASLLSARFYPIQRRPDVIEDIVTWSLLPFDSQPSACRIDMQVFLMRRPPGCRDE